MTVQGANEDTMATRAATAKGSDELEFPVREYISAMAVELAQMARWDGDEALSLLLDSAAALAAEPLARTPLEIAKPSRPRPA